MKNVSLIIRIFTFLSLGALYLTKLTEIPFHPDEATFLYTSQEFEIMMTDPFSLAWEPDHPLDNLTRLRMLDEPLSRFVFGLVRKSAGIPTADLPADWDWTMTWEENFSNNAFPNEELLALARATMAFFTFSAAFILFIFTKGTGNMRAGVIALLFFSLNGLLLLHGRRAMRDGVMLFGISLVIWSFIWAAKKPWVAGIVAAIMLCARYSTAPYVILGFTAAVWEPISNDNPRRTIKNAAGFTSTFLVVFLLLQPVLWLHPIEGLQEMARMRIAFTSEGVATARELAPNAVFNSFPEKFAGLIYHGFVGPISYFEFANYEPELRIAISKYERIPYFHLWRGMILGSVFLFLTLLGIVLTIYRFVRRPGSFGKRITLILTGAFFETIFILATIPFPSQRYYLPLLPFFSILAGLTFVSWEKDTLTTGSHTP